MAFEPFGYPFEVKSPKNIAAVKAAIRESRQGWFDPKEGPRGWMIGPFMCLWNGAFQRYGPMVLAKISDQAGMTLIRGRAGSDLNGTLALLVWAAVLLLLIMLAALHEGQSLDQFGIVIGIMLVALPLTLWMAHSDKREADTLVRFIRRAVDARSAVIAVTEGGNKACTASLIIDGKAQSNPASVDDVRAAIERLSVDGFVILERGPEEYMQLLSRRGDYQLEKREGSGSRHFQVHLRKGLGFDDPSYERSERIVIEAMTDYLVGRTERAALGWKRVDV